VEYDCDFYFVFGFEESFDVVFFGVVVVWVDFWVEFDFFDDGVDLVFLGFMGFESCFVFVFVEVYEFVDWWMGGRGYLD